MKPSLIWSLYRCFSEYSAQTHMCCKAGISMYVWHYDDVIMSVIASQITSLTIVYSTVYPGADQSKHQSSASLAFVWGIHRRPVNSPHKWPVTRKMFPFDYVIMTFLSLMLTLGFDHQDIESFRCCNLDGIDFVQLYLFLFFVAKGHV